MSKRYFTCSEKGSNKFWSIDVVLDGDYEFTVNYGKMGTAGQTKTKEFGSAEECEKAANVLIEQKIKKGYIESKV
jgi:predicted DNA-binding WGR domain protein